MKINIQSLLFLLFLGSCNPDFSNPKEVVKQYYSNLTKKKYKKNYKLISDTCKSFMSFQEYYEYCTKNDSLEKRIVIQTINPLPLEASRLKTRSFKVSYVELFDNERDTIITYVSLINEKNKWKVVWIGTLQESAYSLITSENYKDAISLYNIAVSLAPFDDYSYLCLGWCYNSLNKTSEAIKNTNKAIELNPQVYHGYELLADIYLKDEEESLAIENYKSAIKYVPEKRKKVELLISLSDLYNRNADFINAFKYINEALSLDPENTFGWCAKSLFFENQGQNLDSVIFCLRTASQLKELDHQQFLYFNLAKALYNKSKLTILSVERAELLNEAKKTLYLALEIDSTNTEFLDLLRSLN